MFKLSGEYASQYKKVKHEIKKQARFSKKRTEAIKDLYNLFVQLQIDGGSLEEFENSRWLSKEIVVNLPKKNKYLIWIPIGMIFIFLVSTIIYLSRTIVELRQYRELDAPIVILTEDNVVQWNPIEEAEGYRVYVNGILRGSTDETSYNLYHLDYNRQFTIEVEVFSNNKYLKNNKSTPLLITTSRKQSQVYEFKETSLTLDFDDQNRAHVILSPNYSGQYRITPSIMSENYSFYIEDITNQETVLLFEDDTHYLAFLLNERVYELTVSKLHYANPSIDIALSIDTHYESLDDVHYMIMIGISVAFEYQNMTGEDQYFQYTGHPDVEIGMYLGLEYESAGLYGLMLDDNIIKIDKNAPKLIFEITSTNQDDVDVDIEFIDLTDTVVDLPINQTYTFNQAPLIFTHTLEGQSEIIIESVEEDYIIGLYLNDGTKVQFITHTLSDTEIRYEIPEIYRLSEITIIIYKETPQNANGQDATILIQPKP